MTRISNNLALILYYSIGNKISDKLGGNTLRSFLSRFIFKNVGRSSKIFSNVYFGNGNSISIGNNSLIGPDCRLILGAEIKIGNDVQIGPNTTILTGNHVFSDPNIPFRLQGSTHHPVTIEDDVWIAANVTILPGVIIGRSSVVGAGAVVTKDVEPYSIVAGNPARTISTRKPNERLDSSWEIEK